MAAVRPSEFLNRIWMVGTRGEGIEMSPRYAILSFVGFAVWATTLWVLQLGFTHRFVKLSDFLTVKTTRITANG